jgi:hypothetical protein
MSLSTSAAPSTLQLHSSTLSPVPCRLTTFHTGSTTSTGANTPHGCAGLHSVSFLLHHHLLTRLDTFNRHQRAPRLRWLHTRPSLSPPHYPISRLDAFNWCHRTPRLASVSCCITSPTCSLQPRCQPTYSEFVG